MTGKVLPLPMKGAEQRKQAPGGRFVHADLPVEPLHDKGAAFGVQGAPRHVDGLDLGWRRGLYGLEIALADQEIIFDDFPEGVERKKKGCARIICVPRRDREGEAVLNDRDCEMVRAGRSGHKLERVLFEKIVNRNLALVVDFRRVAPNRPLVEVDLDQPRGRKDLRFVKHRAVIKPPVAGLQQRGDGHQDLRLPQASSSLDQARPNCPG